jgi:hypothetical protein
LLRHGDGSLAITDIGRHFVELGSESRTEISVGQGKMLAALFLDDVEVSRAFDLLSRSFRRDYQGCLSLPPRGIRAEEVRILAVGLQQMGALTYRDGRLVLNEEFESVLLPEPLGKAALSEHELLKLIEVRRLRAKEAEKVALAEERKRLLAAGREDLADAVVHLGEDNVNAGYDIGSYEIDGRCRYIEVKSSTGRRVHFEWSASERAFATKNSRDYWVYFVPLSYALPALLSPIYMIPDPLGQVRRKRLKEEPTRYLVTGPNVRHGNAVQPSAVMLVRWSP